ncbi:MAG: GNAT family N-acetyltransferase [Cyclobacteriaceae bacterium]
MLTFKPVQSDDEVEIVAQLAREIWTEYFTPMIGAGQVNYMLANMQSFGPMKKQLAEGYEYYQILNDATPVGYICIKPEEDWLFLSKLYLLKSARGSGLGKQAFQFILQQASDRSLEKIWLTVNKQNVDTIKAYQKWGFEIVGEPVADIGGGFVMDDYRMEKSIGLGA